MAIISSETKLVRLLQGMIQDLASTCLISGRRAGALADDGGVLLIKAEQVAVCHKFTSALAALPFPKNCFLLCGLQSGDLWPLPLKHTETELRAGLSATMNRSDPPSIQQYTEIVLNLQKVSELLLFINVYRKIQNVYY